MRNSLIAVVLITLASLADAGPSSKTAIKEDYGNVCHAIERSGASKLKDVNERAVKIANCLRNHIKTPEVNDFVRKLGERNLAPEEKGPRSRKRPPPRATRANVQSPMRSDIDP